jgi:hypothetical protein
MLFLNVVCLRLLLITSLESWNFSQNKCLGRMSDMTIFIGYVNNVMIEILIYVTSRMRINGQIMDFKTPKM